MKRRKKKKTTIGAPESVLVEYETTPQGGAVVTLTSEATGQSVMLSAADLGQLVEWLVRP